MAKVDAKIQQEMEYLRYMIDTEVKESTLKKRKRSLNSVSKLSNALNQYKTNRIKAENDLI